jgi:hypothetical protein
MLQWLEIQQIVQTIHLDDSQDCLIWKWEASGVYSVKSLYDVVNFGGIQTVGIHCVCKIKVPPKIHFFSFGCFPTTGFSLEIIWSKDRVLMI